MTCHNCEAEATKHGKTSKGLQRYKCNPCKKTFSEFQEKPLDNIYLPMDKAKMCLHMLLEGSSIRSIERITNVNRNTIMKLLVVAGEKCERLMKEKIRNVCVKDVQADELWGFIGMKQKTANHKQLDDRKLGSCYTFVGMETNSKLILAWHLGRRNVTDTVEFTEKLEKATSRQFQLTTDRFPAYSDAVSYSLGTRIDYAQLVKIYENPKEKAFSNEILKSDQDSDVWKS